MHRAALEANSVCDPMVFSRKVSISWAAIMGAVTSRTGSLAKKMDPSGALFWTDLLRYQLFAVDLYSIITDALHIRP